MQQSTKHPHPVPQKLQRPHPLSRQRVRVIMRSQVKALEMFETFETGGTPASPPTPL